MKSKSVTFEPEILERHRPPPVNPGRKPVAGGGAPRHPQTGKPPPPSGKAPQKAQSEEGNGEETYVFIIYLCVFSLICDFFSVQEYRYAFSTRQRIPRTPFGNPYSTDM